MIEVNAGGFLKNFDNKVITKVNSIIITTDAGDIILAPCKDTVVSLTTTETVGLLNSITKKEATIETEYDNIVIVK